MRRRLTRQEVDTKPYLVWNAYINLLATQRYEDLTTPQRPPHLVFWYESEVQNGGHLQYFENRGTAHLAETVEALGTLGASCQQAVLRDAGALWLDKPRMRPETAEQFVEVALEGEFSAFDQRFHNCTPDLQAYLERYLREHESDFVIVTADGADNADRGIA